MGLHWISNLPPTAGVEATAQVAPTAGHAIGFDLSDAGLERLLFDMVTAQHGLHVAEVDAADVVVTDRDADDTAHPGRVLRIGAAQARRNSVDGFEPGVILAAASLLAAGYSVERDRPGASNGAMARLSRRERQVAELLVNGASNKVIARDLDISVHTAKFHVTAILDKLKARNRADAVAILLRDGLIAA